MNQLSIDFAPYVRHSATSKSAAKALTMSKVNQDRITLLMALKRYPLGLTDDALQAITGLPGDSERPRRISLLNDKPPQIRDSGRKERTRSGKLAVVWVLAH